MRSVVAKQKGAWRSGVFFESKQEIRKSKMLRPLLRDQPLETLASTEGAVQSGAAVSKEQETVEPVNPRIEWREKMREIRRKYIQESQQQREQAKAAEQEALAESQKKMAQFHEDIAKFKKERRAKLADISFDPEIDPETEKDAILGKRQEKWLQLKEETRRMRLNNQLKTRKEQSDQRLSAFVQLFHDTAEFVTLANLDQKLDDVFQTAIPKQKYLKPPLLRPIELFEKTRMEAVGRERAEHLQSILNSKTDSIMSNPSLESIRALLQEREKQQQQQLGEAQGKEEKKETIKV